MTLFAKGQRWISMAEPELGLGTLIGLTRRRIILAFQASDCTREYTLESAPLKRIKFKPGDHIQHKNGNSITITTVNEQNGLIEYLSDEGTIHESAVSDTISYSLPEDRLNAGLVESPDTFSLRYRIHELKKHYDHSPAKGFLGGQIDLIPHQFYIAQEVCSRWIPRVLLSDETGLGKTIEACLILHHLLVCERIRRVLVIVPDSLVHQWFVELYRKFNLSFRLYNTETIDDILSLPVDSNPFLEDQTGIISMEDVEKHAAISQLILDAGWDMVIVDEIHHIDYLHPSYSFFEQISRRTRGLMLLSATPEQMGVENYFSHLRLLDPERYYDFDAYTDEMNGYQDLAETIEQLVTARKPYDRILDSYGPGRVIFKNTRKVVKGFPKRTALLYPLDASADQRDAIHHEFTLDRQGWVDDNNIHTLETDPRILRIVDLLKTYPTEKFLLICTTPIKAAAVKKALEHHININSARFDETMSLLQRDRNAAWFSRDAGARMLICSEIGSEGRNFQFSRHLILFDLPVNPELLEQRIGRLDRIGQKKDIFIHVPFVTHTAYALLARWYMDGLNSLEHNVAGAHQIYMHFKNRLEGLLDQICDQSAIDDRDIHTFISNTRTHTRTIQQTLAKGKNILLALSSYKSEPAKALIEQINQVDQADDVKEVFLSVLDEFNIDYDLLEPAGKDDTMLMFKTPDHVEEGFPLPDRPDRLSRITFDRQQAIQRDDLDFFNSDHPYVQKVFDFIIQTGKGNCAMGCLKHKNGPGLLLDVVYILEAVSPGELQIQRFMPATPVRILMDYTGDDVTGQYDFKQIDTEIQNDSGQWLQEMMQGKPDLITGLIRSAGHRAERRAAKIKDVAQNKRLTILGTEKKRLETLAKVNPAIQQHEIDRIGQQMADLDQAITTARLRLDSLRIIRLE